MIAVVLHESSVRSLHLEGGDPSVVAPSAPSSDRCARHHGPSGRRSFHLECVLYLAPNLLRVPSW